MVLFSKIQKLMNKSIKILIQDRETTLRETNHNCHKLKNRQILFAKVKHHKQTDYQFIYKAPTHQIKALIKFQI